jgi:hypothetical protein
VQGNPVEGLAIFLMRGSDKAGADSGTILVGQKYGVLLSLICPSHRARIVEVRVGQDQRVNGALVEKCAIRIELNAVRAPPKINPGKPQFVRGSGGRIRIEPAKAAVFVVSELITMVRAVLPNNADVFAVVAVVPDECFVNPRIVEVRVEIETSQTAFGKIDDPAVRIEDQKAGIEPHAVCAAVESSVNPLSMPSGILAFPSAPVRALLGGDVGVGELFAGPADAGAPPEEVVVTAAPPWASVYFLMIIWRTGLEPAEADCCISAELYDLRIWVFCSSEREGTVE